MKSDGIWGNIFKFSHKKQTLAEVLHSVPLFAELNVKELKVLVEAVHIRTYQPGEMVFVESEPGAGMYIIQSGFVRIVLEHTSDNPIVLAELETGDFFGEMALLGDTMRSATAIARERSELIGFFHPDLEEIINLHPHIGAKIAMGLSKTLAERLRYTNGRLREIFEIRATHETSLG